MRNQFLFELFLNLLKEGIEREERIRKARRDFFNFETSVSSNFDDEDFFEDEGTPKDDNKIFGVNIRVDEPRAQDYTSMREFLRDHHYFDELINAAEKCKWENKSNDAPLHKVNAVRTVRRRIDEGPVIGLDLIGETDWSW